MAPIRNPTISFGGPYCKWNPPSGDTIKFNEDAQFDVSTSRACSGIIGRNENGALISGTSIKFFAKNAPTAEALALRDAITLAYGLNLSSIIVDFDCLIAIEMYRGRMIRREIDHLVHDILSLRANFISVTFNWTKRDGNAAIDMIAKLGARDLLRSDWVLNPPVTLREIVESESVN